MDVECNLALIHQIIALSPIYSAESIIFIGDSPSQMPKGLSTTKIPIEDSNDIIEFLHSQSFVRIWVVSAGEYDAREQPALDTRES